MDQILLLAPELLGESLALQLSSINPQVEIVLKSEELSKNPSLVIWSIENIYVPGTINHEIKKLKEFWYPSPILILLPLNINLSSDEILKLESQGILQDTDTQTLNKAIQTLMNGGKVIKLKNTPLNTNNNSSKTIGLTQWLLISGIQQIEDDLNSITQLLSCPKTDNLSLIINKGRKRELLLAKKLLHYIWGPLEISINSIELINKPKSFIYKQISNNSSSFSTNITIKDNTPYAIWEAIKDQLEININQELKNSTGTLLAIDIINPPRKYQLLNSLISQFGLLLKRLENVHNNDDFNTTEWLELQTELRREALRSMTGSYVQLSKGGDIKIVSDELIKMTTLKEEDQDLPDFKRIIDPLLFNFPVLIEGQLLPPDDPRSLIHLENLLSNWIIRTAEIISGEIIESSSTWVELRRYMLSPHLISTRELERFRNQLNSQSRWNETIKRPIEIYESKRPLFKLNDGEIEIIFITEPRDEELKDLNWIQQQVALLVEARDAISPQLQALIKHTGDFMVVLLTQVIGRAIGLIGKGIAQGMGRSIGRN